MSSTITVHCVIYVSVSYVAAIRVLYAITSHTVIFSMVYMTTSLGWLYEWSYEDSMNVTPCYAILHAMSRRGILSGLRRCVPIDYMTGPV